MSRPKYVILDQTGCSDNRASDMHQHDGCNGGIKDLRSVDGAFLRSPSYCAAMIPIQCMSTNTLMVHVSACHHCHQVLVHALCCTLCMIIEITIVYRQQGRTRNRSERERAKGANRYMVDGVVIVDKRPNGSE